MIFSTRRFILFLVFALLLLLTAIGLTYWVTQPMRSALNILSTPGTLAGPTFPTAAFVVPTFNSCILLCTPTAVRVN